MLLALVPFPARHFEVSFTLQLHTHASMADKRAFNLRFKFKTIKHVNDHTPPCFKASGLKQKCLDFSCRKNNVAKVRGPDW